MVGALVAAGGAARDERWPWLGRRFVVRDPSGILVDVVEQIEPAPGYWEGSYHAGPRAGQSRCIRFLF